MATEPILPARSLSGAVAPRGDKSISHRYAILASLADGRSTIENFSPAADCASTLDCLRRLGVAVEQKDRLVSITAAGLRGLRPPRRTLDARNSGTTLRLLTGLLAAQPFASSLSGDRSLRSRPMQRLIDPLTSMGARIRSKPGGLAPLDIDGAQLHGISYSPPIPSAQVKSALLLAGLFASGATSITEPAPTRDHTELALAEFGVPLEISDSSISLTPSPNLRLEPRALSVPGDLSSASFFLIAPFLLPDSSVRIHRVGLNPTRTAILDALASMGAHLSLSALETHHGELLGDISVQSARLTGGVIPPEDVPRLIDEIPLLAVLAPFTEQGIEIRGAAELRLKESDRIAALAENLRRMGASVEEFPDGLRVASALSAGGLHGAEIDPHNDHRIAMAFAVAALAARGNSHIRDAGCVAVSFPDFFTVLDQIADR